MLAKEICLPFSEWMAQMGGVTEQEQQTLIAQFNAIYPDVLAQLLNTAPGIAPGDLTQAQATEVLAFFNAPRGTPEAVAGQSAAAGGPPVVRYQGALGGPDSAVAGGSNAAPGHQFTVGIPVAGLYDYLHTGT